MERQLQAPHLRAWRGQQTGSLQVLPAPAECTPQSQRCHQRSWGQLQVGAHLAWTCALCAKTPGDSAAGRPGMEAKPWCSTLPWPLWPISRHSLQLRYSWSCTQSFKCQLSPQLSKASGLYATLPAASSGPPRATAPESPECTGSASWARCSVVRQSTLHPQPCLLACIRRRPLRCGRPPGDAGVSRSVQWQIPLAGAPQPWGILWLESWAWREGTSVPAELWQVCRPACTAQVSVPGPPP